MPTPPSTQPTPKDQNRTPDKTAQERSAQDNKEAKQERESRERAAKDLKTSDPNRTYEDAGKEDDDKSDDDQTYIVHTERTVDDKGVQHDKPERLTTEEYNKKAAKEGW